ncbi:MAG: hypothetical protein ACI4P8_06030 [Akkermansia sp.]
MQSDIDTQDEFKMAIKLWLRRQGYDYAWLANQCGVTETTVRNWMAKKSIPAIKVAIIRSVMKDLPMILPRPTMNVREKTVLELTLTAEMRAALESKAAPLGKSLAEYVQDMLQSLVH